MTPEDRKFIITEIEKRINIILSGKSGLNTVESESILDLFPGMPEIEKRPVMHPFGMASRAPSGTLQVTGRQGEHVGNRLVLGHRDAIRPQDLESGESVIYSSDGKTVLKSIYVKSDKITIGSTSSSDNLLLGKTFTEETLTNLLLQLIDLVDKLMTQRETDSTHNHIGIFGVPVNTPIQSATMTAEKEALASIKTEIEKIKADDVDSKRIMSDISFTEK